MNIAPWSIEQQHLVARDAAGNQIAALAIGAGIHGQLLADLFNNAPAHTSLLLAFLRPDMTAPA